MRHRFVIVSSLLALAATGGVNALGDWSVLVAIAWTVTMIAAVVVATALRAGDGETAMRAAMAPAAAVLPLALLTLLQLGSTLLAEPAQYRCGGPVPPHVVALGFAAGGALFAYQAPALTPRNGAARWGLVLALAVALVAVAGVTVARRHAAGRFPAANAWVSARPVVARFAAASADGGHDVACGGGVCVERDCRHGEEVCSVSLVGAQRRSVGDIAYDGFHVSVSRANEVEVRRVVGGRVLVQQVARSSWRYLPSTFDARTGERVGFELDDVKATVAAPPATREGESLAMGPVSVSESSMMTKRKSTMMAPA